MRTLIYQKGTGPERTEATLQRCCLNSSMTSSYSLFCSFARVHEHRCVSRKGVTKNTEQGDIHEIGWVPLMLTALLQRLGKGHITGVTDLARPEDSHKKRRTSRVTDAFSLSGFLVIFCPKLLPSKDLITNCD